MKNGEKKIIEKSELSEMARTLIKKLDFFLPLTLLWFKRYGDC
jgi:hypothetical protein